MAFFKASCQYAPGITVRSCNLSIFPGVRNGCDCPYLTIVIEANHNQRLLQMFNLLPAKPVRLRKIRLTRPQDTTYCQEKSPYFTNIIFRVSTNPLASRRYMYKPLDSPLASNVTLYHPGERVPLTRVDTC